MGRWSHQFPQERELLQSGRLVVEVSEASDEIWGPPKA